MFNTKRFKGALAMALILSGGTMVVGCSKGGDSAAATGSSPTTATSTGRASILVSAVNARLGENAIRLRRPEAAALAEAANTNNDDVGSILSAPPESFLVYLKKIEGIQLDENEKARGVEFWASEEEDGTAMLLESGDADLSSLGLDDLEVPAGDYVGIRVTFARVGRIKGCVRGTFTQAVESVTGTYSISDLHGENEYTSNAMEAGTYTFCTRADRSQLDVETFSTDLIGSNEDYMNREEAEEVEIDLEGGNDAELTIDEIREAETFIEREMEFSVEGDQDSPVVLTLAVDLNRMLRFYANTRTDVQPPNPGMKAGTSYFFTTVFHSSVLFFAGEIGTVEGYSMTATVERGDDPTIYVPAWLTVFKNEDGEILAANMMPDDDNSLTIMKGHADEIVANEESWDLHLDVSASTLIGFATLEEVDDEGECTLEITMEDDLNLDNNTFEVAYKREL